MTISKRNGTSDWWFIIDIKPGSGTEGLEFSLRMKHLKTLSDEIQTWN